MSHFENLRLSRPDLSVAGPVLCVLISLVFADRHAISQTVTEGSQGLLNVSADVEYIGSAACQECHRDQHQSWLQTTHSRSMQKVSMEESQASAAFHHQASNTQYEVFLKEDKLIHRETQLDSSGQPLSVTEHPILYTIGSGTHGKGYIYQDKQIFGQSPISWYRNRVMGHVSRI